MNVERFDYVTQIQIDEKNWNLVIHKNAAGEIFAYHTPLTEVPITCSICANGARVYISPEELD